jgi:hypothetical protein
MGRIDKLAVGLSQAAHISHIMAFDARWGTMKVYCSRVPKKYYLYPLEI